MKNPCCRHLVRITECFRLNHTELLLYDSKHGQQETIRTGRSVKNLGFFGKNMISRKPPRGIAASFGHPASATQLRPPCVVHPSICGDLSLGPRVSNKSPSCSFCREVTRFSMPLPCKLNITSRSHGVALPFTEGHLVDRRRSREIFVFFALRDVAFAMTDASIKMNPNKTWSQR